MFCKSTLRRLVTLLAASRSLADIPPLYQSHPYDIGAFDRWPHQLYHSSAAIGPILNYHNKSEECLDDRLYTVVPYWGKQVNIPGVMLLDAEGYLVWHTTGYVTGDIQTSQGENYIVALAMDLTYYALVGLIDGPCYCVESLTRRSDQRTLRRSSSNPCRKRMES